MVPLFTNCIETEKEVIVIVPAFWKYSSARETSTHRGVGALVSLLLQLLHLLILLLQLGRGPATALRERIVLGLEDIDLGAVTKKMTVVTILLPTLSRRLFENQLAIVTVSEE